jgi:hypothetical protein
MLKNNPTPIMHFNFEMRNSKGSKSFWKSQQVIINLGKKNWVDGKSRFIIEWTKRLNYTVIID